MKFHIHMVSVDVRKKHTCRFEGEMHTARPNSICNHMYARSLVIDMSILTTANMKKPNERSSKTNKHSQN